MVKLFWEKQLSGYFSGDLITWQLTTIRIWFYAFQAQEANAYGALKVEPLFKNKFTLSKPKETDVYL